MFNSLIKPIVAVALVSTVAQAEPSRMAAMTQGAQNAFGACVKYAQDHSTATKVVGGVAVTTALGGVAYKLYNRKAKKPVVKTQEQKNQELLAQMDAISKQLDKKPGFFARNTGKIAFGVTTVAALGAGYYFFGDKIVEGAKALYAKLPSVKMSDIFTNKVAAQVTEKVADTTTKVVGETTKKVAPYVPTKTTIIDGGVRVTEQR